MERFVTRNVKKAMYLKVVVFARKFKFQSDNLYTILGNFPNDWFAFKFRFKRFINLDWSQIMKL